MVLLVRTLFTGLPVAPMALVAALLMTSSTRAQPAQPPVAIPPAEAPQQAEPAQADPEQIPPEQTAPSQAAQPDQPDQPVRDLPAQDDGQAEEQPADQPPPPGYIASLEGSVMLERGNQTEEVTVGLPLMVGDRLRTENATADITWADNSTIRLARFTEVDVLSQRMVRVPRGTVNVMLSAPPGESIGEQFALDAPGASVRFFAAGRYRISVNGNDEPDVELAVIEGHAQLASDQGQLTLTAGQKSLVRGGATPTAAVELTAAVNDGSTYDASEDVAAFQRSASSDYQSTQYLPTELYGYASVLDSAGSWQSDPSYGSVWYPRVSADWRPYYRGQWRYYRPWGWTWIGGDRWSYPTHHFGRWGLGSRGWYWIPARRWGPAWVSWAVATDYVGWCPLGWNGRPVVGYFSYSSGRTGRSAGYYSPWRGWTMMASRRFDRHDVSRYRVTQEVLLRDRPAFVTPRAAPRGYAIPRGSAAGIARSNLPLERSNTPLPRSGTPIAGADYDAGHAVPRQGRGAYGSSAGASRDRDESPYDRARRVMQRRADSPRAPDRADDAANANERGQIAPNGAVRRGAASPDNRPDSSGFRSRGDRGDRADRADRTDRGERRRVPPNVSVPRSSEPPAGRSSGPAYDRGSGRSGGGYAVPRGAAPDPAPQAAPRGGDRGDRGDRADRGDRGDRGSSNDRGASSRSGGDNNNRNSGSSTGSGSNENNSGRSSGGRRHP